MLLFSQFTADRGDMDRSYCLLHFGFHFIQIGPLEASQSALKDTISKDDFGVSELERVKFKALDTIIW